jgi:hypothetical protein
MPRKLSSVLLAAALATVALQANRAFAQGARQKIALQEFEQQHRQAVARKRPGGRPGADSKTMASRLLEKHKSLVQRENSRRSPGFGTGTVAVQPGGGPPKSVITQPTPDPCTTPKIQALSALSPLDPGDDVEIQGCGFGPASQKGELRLLGDFPSAVKLEVSQWNGAHIKAKVPWGLKGYKDDSKAKLQVFRKDGKFSNGQTVGFRAAREIQLLRPSDVSFVCYPSNLDNCTLATSHPLADSQFFGGATFAAKHIGWEISKLADCDGAWPLANVRSSSDSASVTLKNGWLLAGYAWWWRYEINLDYGFVDFPSGFQEGKASSTVKMAWKASTHDCAKKRGGVSYRVDLYAIGPAGVPYK